MQTKLWFHIFSSFNLSKVINAQSFKQLLLNKYKIITLFSLFFLANLSWAELNTDPARELGKILQATTTLQANFKQQIYDHKNVKLRQVVGMVAIKKPNLFLWQVTKPEPSLIIVDGKKFWNYDIDLQQVTVQDLADGYNSSPISLFLAADLQEINKRYQVTQSKNKQLTAAKKVCFTLIPKNNTDGFKKVTLTFQHGVINSLLLVDQLEQISKINFTNVQANLALPDKMFVFVPPKGVDVVGTETK